MAYSHIMLYTTAVAICVVLTVGLTSRKAMVSLCELLPERREILLIHDPNARMYTDKSSGRCTHADGRTQ